MWEFIFLWMLRQKVSVFLAGEVIVNGYVEIFLH